MNNLNWISDSMQPYYQIRIKDSFQLTKTKTNKQTKTIEKNKQTSKELKWEANLLSIVARSLIAS